jgi:TATA-box binding protein (TBP) (component of TFIID and TFIIIB)
MIEWRITNIVFTLKFNTNFSIEKMASILTNNGILVDYDPDSFPALIVTFENNEKGKPKKITVFRTGIINIYGLKKIDEIYNIINKIKEIFNKIGINLPDNYEMKLTNIVIAGNFDYKNINIEKMYNDFDNAKYDPGIFPGVSVPYYLSKDYKVTFNIFSDGHFVCAGIRSDMGNINQHINEIVNSFQENVIKKYVRV